MLTEDKKERKREQDTEKVKELQRQHIDKAFMIKRFMRQFSRQILFVTLSNQTHPNVVCGKGFNLEIH